MTDPATLTAGAIATLALTKFVAASAGETAKKLTPAVFEKINRLRQAIWRRLRGIPEVDALKASVEKEETLSETQIQQLTPYLAAAMKADAGFDQEVRQLASEIQQSLMIQQGAHGEVWNVIGHAEKTEFIDNKAPIIKDNQGTVQITYGQAPQ